MHDVPEFVEGDRAIRLRVLGLASVLLLLVLLERLTSPARGLLATDPVLAFKKSADRLLEVVAIAVPLSVAASMYLFRIAVKASRSGQWPPPGIRVPVRTKIFRGRRARLNAAVAFVLAAILSLVGPVLIYAACSLSRLSSELSHRSKHMQAAPAGGPTDWHRSR